MPIIRFFGDVHGKFRKYRELLRVSPYPSIQVGDMGVGFLDDYGFPRANPPYDSMVSAKALFIRGNHDNPKVCKEHALFIKDGSFMKNMMFCGGGFSIDRARRTEGFSWWPDEELPYHR